MTTTTLPRLPRDLTVGGASVAVRLPAEPGSVGHKSDSRRINPDNQYDQRRIVVAKCAPEDEACVEFTAAWADHLGAQACTETACFPDAEPR